MEVTPIFHLNPVPPAQEITPDGDSKGQLTYSPVSWISMRSHEVPVVAQKGCGKAHPGNQGPHLVEVLCRKLTRSPWTSYYTIFIETFYFILQYS